MIRHEDVLLHKYLVTKEMNKQQTITDWKPKGHRNYVIDQT
jgi:hypothetical protein